jgi:hypothetical protein
MLQNRWYNSFTANLHLHRKLFQIRNPVNPLVRSSEELWGLLDCIPPLSLTFRSPAERFSAEYISLVSQFQYPDSGGLRESIGEANHEKWLKYLERIHPPPPESQLPALFRRWAFLSAPSIASAGASKLSQLLILNRAPQNLRAYQGPQRKTIDFSPELVQAKDIVEHSSGFRFAFESPSSPENVDDTWTGGIDYGPDGLWSDATGDLSLNRRFSLNPVTVNLSAKSYAVCTVVPGPWYSSSLLDAAFMNQGRPPWPQNPNPTWNERFGPSGSLRRVIISIVLADGVKATLSSAASFSEDDRRSIKTNASKGVWPLYIPDYAGSASNEVTFGVSNVMNIETVTQPGTLVVLGNNVMEIGYYLAHTVP